MNLSKYNIIVRSEKIAQRLFEERMLVITAKDSMLHRFNEVGTCIWQLLETPKTINEICNKIGKNFEEVNEKQIYTDIVDFIAKLEDKKLVKIYSSDTTLLKDNR